MPNNSRFFFVLLAVGSAIGIGNIFLYPYFKFNFSIMFFIPYVLALVLVGIPLLMMEFSSGQYFGRNVVDMFASIRKWFSGIGWLMIINSFIFMGAFAVALSWHIIYVLVSFGLQWKDNPRTYFFKNVLQSSNGFENFAGLSLPVLIALIIAWVIVFFCIKNGRESIKKSFIFIVPAGLALLMLFFLYSLSLDNAISGVYSFIKADFSELLSLNLWISAFSLAVLSLGVAFGIMHSLGDKTKKRFVISNSFIVILSKTAIAMAFALMMFAIFGFLKGKGLIAETFDLSNYGDIIITFSQALPFFFKPTILSIMFFTLLSLFLLLAVCALAYSAANVVAHKFNTTRLNASILACSAGFMIGLVFIIKPGFYIMDIAVHFVFYNIMAALLLETLALGWFFNSEKLSSFIDRHSSLKLGGLWRFFIRYIIPPVLIALIAFQLQADIFSRYHGYPPWAILSIGWGIVAIPLIISFLMPHRILDRR
jgi:neurotransmitter:Na+ symporter, NSS family